MSVELTREQQALIDRVGKQPATVRDPRSQTDYVLVPLDQFEQMLEIVEDDVEQRSLRRAAARGLANRLAEDKE